MYFVALEIGSRRLIHSKATEHPTAEWTLQQLRKAVPGDQDYKFLLRDRHTTFSADLDKEVQSWGIHALRSPVRRPTANAHCERLIGTIRRECLDYVIPLGVCNPRRILREWTCHYNTGRPHRSLAPGIPDRRNETLVAGIRSMASTSLHGSLLSRCSADCITSTVGNQPNELDIGAFSVLRECDTTRIDGFGIVIRAAIRGRLGQIDALARGLNGAVSAVHIRDGTSFFEVHELGTDREQDWESGNIYISARR
jgi:Integrase core domain